MTGWTANQAMGEPVQRVFHIVNEQTGQPMEDVVGRILLDGGPVPLAEHAALVTKNGATLPVEDSASPILDAEGKVIGVALVFQYVTEKRRTQEAMQKYRATLEQRAVERTAMAKNQAMQLRQVALELSDTEERERKRYKYYEIRIWACQCVKARNDKIDTFMIVLSCPSLYVFLALLFNLANVVFDGHAFKQSLPFHRVISSTRSELAQKANRIDDSEFFYQNIRGAPGCIGNGLKGYHFDCQTLLKLILLIYNPKIWSLSNQNFFVYFVSFRG